MTAKAQALDFARTIGKSKNTEFEEYCSALDKLMMKGLSRLPLATQEMVAQTVEAGGEVVVVTTWEPTTLNAVLKHGDGQGVQLFRIRETFH